MNSKNKILIITIAVLFLTATAAIILNRGNIEAQRELNNNAIFIIKENGQEVAQFNMSEIQAIGEIEFEATIRSSGRDPQDNTYTGVLLRNIFEHAGVSLENHSAIVVTAADGYASAVDIEKVLDDDNVYLAYIIDGELLGTREEGGVGPYQLIIRKDPFSQFWVKFAVSADIN